MPRGRPRKISVSSATPTQTQQVLVPTEAFLYFLYPDGGRQIKEDDVKKVKNAISGATLKELNLVVHSRGGDPYSAVRIIRILRSKFDKIIGFVPIRAKSAATLMLLGANEIYMSEDSQLGPLDLPIQHPVDGSIISAIDVVNSFNQLASSVMVNAREMYEEMRENLPNSESIGKVQAMKMALDACVELAKPITAQTDPYHRQMAFRQLKIAQTYANDLLKSGMLKNKPYTSQITALRFVHTYPDHSYAIFREEAVDNLRLEIRDSKTYTGWDSIYSEVETKIKNSSVPTIEYIEK